ncbi:MAG: NRDE family protein [Woeseiaceae bacterium]|nr:NRDE family protein [Woeseiaceae bacterium]
MCLIVFAVRPDDEHVLLLAGNRDEFHERPTEPLAWWKDRPDVVGGRDAQAGGTWLAASRRGRFATVTNSRDAEPPDPGLRSRGLLVTDFLDSELSPMAFLEAVDGAHYAGFNLVISDGRSVAYGGNRGAGPRELGPGVYAVSNAVLDTPWHKVEYAKSAFDALTREGLPNDESLLELLANDQRAPIESVQPGKLPIELAHAITAPFIVGSTYGTRSMSIVRLQSGGDISIVERRFGADGHPTGEDRVSYSSS